MKPASALLLLLLAAASSTSALNTPHIRIRQDANSTTTDAAPVCAGAAIVSSSTVLAGAASIELTKFSCAPLAPFIEAHGGGLLGLLGGLLGWLFPHPHPPKPPKHTTATVTATKTATATATVTATKTDTATETETDTATLTVTATVSASSPSSTATNVCGVICTTVCGESGQLPPVSEDCQTLVDSITILNGQIPPTFDVEPNHVQTISFGTCRFFFENVGPAPLEYCWLSLAQTASASGSACFPPVQPVMSEALCIPADATWEVGAAHS